MNKFTQNLTKNSKEIKAGRAAIVGSDVAMAHEDLLRDLYKKKNRLDSELLQLCDIGPDTKDSLRPVSHDFKAEDWVAEKQRIEVELANLSVEIDIAEKTKREWFSASEEGGE